LILHAARPHVFAAIGLGADAGTRRTHSPVTLDPALTETSSR